MQIFVKDKIKPSGEIISLSVDSSCSIANVKTLLQSKLDIPVKWQWLVFERKVLEDDLSLRDYNVREGSTLVMISRSFSNGCIRVLVKDNVNKCIALGVQESDSIETLKKLIYAEEESIIPEMQHLCFAGKILKNSEIVSDCKIQDESTIFLGLSTSLKKKIGEIKNSATSFLMSVAGLSETEATSLSELTGAYTQDDLLLIQPNLDSIVQSMKLKMVPAQKLSNALALLKQKKEQEILKQTLCCEKNVVDNARDVCASTNANVKECISIAIDHSYSMGSAFDETQSWCDDGNQNALKKTLKRRSRMDAVKQIFYAFRDRTETLESGTHQIGLIQFDNKVEKMMDLECNLELFESIVDDVTKRGSTAIYSAIIEAAKMLKPMFLSDPHIDLRVLLLTDGENNAGASHLTALEAVFEIGAIVDAIIVGNCPDENLRKIVSATGGNCYQIRSLSEGFDLMEAEAVVSLLARRGGTDKPAFVKKQVPNLSMFASIKAQKIVNGKNAAKAAAAAAPPPVQPKKLVNSYHLSSTAQETTSNLGTRASIKRILKELRTDLERQSGIHLFPDATNLFVMRALIEAPVESPFEGGVFALNISVPQDYPFKPPSITFATPIYHCNVSEFGQLCLDILRHQWTPALTIPKVLSCIRMMLANPNTDNALRSWIAELTLMHRKSAGTDTRYVDAARRSTKENASRSVKEWKVLWGLED